MFLALISLVSANVDFSPNSISLSGYSGEDVIKEVRISQTAGTYLVFNISDNDIYFHPKHYTMKSSVDYVNFSFEIPQTSSNKNYSFILTATYNDTPASFSQSSSTSHNDEAGDYYILPKKTTPTNQTNITTPIETSTTTNETTTEEPQETKTNWWIIAIVIGVIIIFILLFLWFVNSSGNKDEPEEGYASNDVPIEPEEPKPDNSDEETRYV